MRLTAGVLCELAFSPGVRGYQTFGVILCVL
jgi:hypothetical protein